MTQRERGKNIMIIAGYRKMTGLTQREMADKIGISEGTYRNKEKGKASFKDNEMKVFYELVKKTNPSVDFQEIFFTEETTQNDAMEVG